MTIIKCPECGKEISSLSNQCIYCGFPLVDVNDTEKMTENSGVKNGSVYLVEYRNNKVAVIRTLREITGLDLAEAKKLVDLVPSCIMKNITKEEFETYQHKFNSVGATVMYVPTDADVEVDKNKDQIVKNKTSNNKETFRLIKCPACGKDVSNFAYNCPHCGQPLGKSPEKNNSQMSFGSVVGAIIVAVLILAFL